MKQFEYVEDYLELIAGYRDVVSGLRNPNVYFFSPIISLARYDTGVLDSMSMATMDSRALTERQGELAIKIVAKYKKQLSQKLIDTTPVETKAKFRVTPRRMDYRRSLFIKNEKLVAKFPYDTKIIEQIRAFKKDAQGTCEFDTEAKEWTFGMTEYNLNWVNTLAVTNGFEVDLEVKVLVEKLSDAENSPHVIELFVDGDMLNITNCPDSLRDYINDHLGGFELTNLEKLADHAGELGYTIRRDLMLAMSEQYSNLFVKIASMKEAKLQQITQDRFEELLQYATSVGRLPVVIYEPNQSGALRDMLLSSKLSTHVQMIDSKFGKKAAQEIAIDTDAQIVYTIHTIRNMEYIPMLISTGGMIYGSDKQIMFQNAGKVLYLTPDVYRGKPGTNTPTVENLDL